MARNRVIYQSEALYVSATGTATPSQLHRVQSANYSFEVSRTDINQFGELAAIDRIIVEQPTVSLDFSYYPTTGWNEGEIGLVMGGDSAISALLAQTATATPKCYFIATAHEGQDANKLTTTQWAANVDASGAAGIIGIGNGFLTSFSTEGSVGELLTTSVNVEALNMAFEAHEASDSAANIAITGVLVNPINGDMISATYTLPKHDSHDTATSSASYVNALRHGDMELTLGTNTKGISRNDLKVQNFTWSFELSRENLEKIGSKFAFSKEIEFPTTATMDVSAILGDLVDNDSFAGLLTNDPEADLSVACYRAGAKGSATSTDRSMKYTLLGAKLDSQSFSSSIGDNKSVDMTWTSQVGGPNDTTHGVKIEHAWS